MLSAFTYETLPLYTDMRLQSQFFNLCGNFFYAKMSYLKIKKKKLSSNQTTGFCCAHCVQLIFYYTVNDSVT